MNAAIHIRSLIALRPVAFVAVSQGACRAILALLAHPEADSPLNCDAGQTRASIGIGTPSHPAVCQQFHFYMLSDVRFASVMCVCGLLRHSLLFLCSAATLRDHPTRLIA